MDEVNAIIMTAASAVVTLIAAVAMKRKKRQRKDRTVWVRHWVMSRPGRALEALQADLLVDANSEYINFLRMDAVTFELLLSMVGPVIKKQNTIMRESIDPRNRLLATIRFLASGEPYSELQYAARIPQCTFSRIIPETCVAIHSQLQEDHFKVPNTFEQWMEIAEGFYSKWNFANCLGAVDGKHIKVKPPQGKGAKYWCYKGYNNILLLALVDADSKFIYVDVGANGRVGDSDVYARCSLKKCLSSRNILNIPTTGNLPNSAINVPYVVLGDDAFPLSVNLLKPCPFKGISSEERYFNRRLSRARVMVECAFGILANRFRIFLSSIHLEPHKVKLITLTACALHNFLRGTMYSRLQTGDRGGAQLHPDDDQRLFDIAGQIDVGHGMHGSEKRDVFRDYYSGPGHITFPRQD